MRSRTSVLALVASFVFSAAGYAQEPAPGRFNGLNMNLGNLHRLSNAQTRSISPENFTGEKGKAGMATEGTGAGCAKELGQGWKISPSVRIKAKSTFIMGEIEGPGAIQQIWMTPAPIDKTRHFILRFYWDGEEEPSIEVPMGDFFACGWGQYCQINSLPVCVNPGSAFNCYWTMPFRKKAKVTMENLDDRDMTLYYQINYTLTEVPDDAAYFHAQFRRVPKLPAKTVYTILDGVRGRGQYVGTYLAWEVRSPGWWGEGEIKFFMDGDKEFPTICGTGTEDYFCGSYNFENRRTRRYQEFSTPYTGLAQVLPPDVIYLPGQRFGLYRWHVADPVRFTQDLKVTIQALGWRQDKKGLYLPLEDDIASVAYWYQTEPHAKFPALPDRGVLSVRPISVEPAPAREPAKKSPEPASSSASPNPPAPANAGGLEVTDLVVGTGAVAEPGKAVTVHYRGTLTNGKEFDASRKHGQPFTFNLGAREVIRGWDEGVKGMKVGGKRKLVIPPSLGYGADGAGDVIPPNATLVFEVELIEVK